MSAADSPGILLWPGLGASRSYFAAVADALPGRAVAVDPPGCGPGAAPLDPPTYEQLLGIARDLVARHDCRAVVGHSLGAYIAASLAADPPDGLSAAVLIDGGFLSARDMAELGMPLLAGRGELVSWLEANRLRFHDWDTATAQLATLICSQPTPALAAYVREVFGEVDGEICELGVPERMADLLLATLERDVRAPAAALKIPTLLIACGLPDERRTLRQSAWQTFAEASPMIELEVYEEWGHNPVLQDPAAAGAVIGSWLAEHV